MSTTQAANQYEPRGLSTVVLASAARTASGNQGATYMDVSAHSYVGLEVAVTVATGTSPAVTVFVEWSNDGTNWATAEPTDTFGNYAVTRRFKSFPVKSRYFRIAWTITGTTPSLTFAVNGVFK